jgi:F-type H+-transporting ATPase subunit gamma
MPAQLQAMRRQIRSVKSIKKITKAQELVATSRIGKAQERVAAARPYAVAITNVLSALASNAAIDHPLLVLYVIGRKGVGYYQFRNRPVESSWTGFSEQPTFDNAREVGEILIKAFTAGADDELSGPGVDGVHGVDELHVVSTQFKTLMTQAPSARLLAPMEVEHAEGLLPAYEFEPDPETLLDALLPKYINTRIYAALLDSAASESASRRRAMKAATDNADELLTKYTRLMNSARQADITQEISEIVGGANALAMAGSE